MTRREFRFVEGTSNKFWAVSVTDTTMTVQFGKVGTAGQTQVKSFGSADEARAAAEKLIGEKTRKGYQEVAGDTPAPAAQAKAAPATPRIRLDPADWLWARWRERPAAPPIEPPTPRPFNLAALKGRIPTEEWNQFSDAWNAAAPPDHVTPQEAVFWFRLFTEWYNRTKSRKRWIDSLTADELRPPVPFAEMFEKLFWQQHAEQNWPVLRLQACWMPPGDWMRLACDNTRVNADVRWYTRPAADWIEAHFLPRLDEAGLKAVRAALADRLVTPGPFPEKLEDNSRQRVEAEGRATAAILATRVGGLEAEVRAFVEAHSPKDFENWRFGDGRLTEALLGLSDPAYIEQQVRRLGLLFQEPQQARGWLAHTEDRALDVLRDSVLQQRRTDDAQAILDVLMLVETPAAARPLMELRLGLKSSKLIGRAAKWFEKHREIAVEGLTSLAGEKTKLGEAARTFVEEAGRRGAASQTAPTAPGGPGEPGGVSPRSEKTSGGSRHPARPEPALPAPERRLNLAPEDWQRVKVTEPATSLPPSPRPFDLDALKAQALPQSRNMPFDPALPVTPEEARFWLYVFGTLSTQESYSREREIRKLTAARFQKPLTLDQVRKACEQLHYWDVNLPILRMQRSWIAPADLVELIAFNNLPRMYPAQAAEMAAWLEAEVYPRLDEKAMDEVRDRLRTLLSGGGEPALVAAVLARHAGLDDTILAFVTTMKKGGIPTDKVNMGWASLLFVLKDADRLVAEFRRLGLKLTNPTDARTWLVRTGHAALDVLRDSILAQRKAADALALLDVLLLAESPEAAAALLEVKLKAKAPDAGPRIDAWFRAHRDHAVAGLTPLSADQTPLGEAARAFLAEAGPPGDAPPAPAGDVAWLRAALDATKPARSIPPFADPAILPPIHGLAAADVNRVVSALMASTLPGPHPLVAALRRQGDRAALSAFAWKLFEGWLAAGAPSKEKWALLAVGHLGDDAAVLRLAPLVRAWPGESQHQRAVTGLEVLRTIGTDAALTQLNGMALKLKFKALQERARALMDAIAADRGLSRDQLEDRIVPDLGLDADGGRTFDFGPRRFRFVFTDELTPAVTDEGGKPLKDLPKPGAKDDAGKAAEAAAAWKQLKAQLRETLKVQLMRLEAAMITGRSWTVEEFRTLLVGHPLMSHLVRRLVWEGPRPFRVTEAGATVSHDGSPVSLEGAEGVRVAHRLRLTAGQVGSWRQEMDRCQIIPPFPQMDRPVYAPDANEAAGTNFVRPAVAVPAAKMRGTLEERGWRRLMHDQGGITGFSKAYPAADVTAVVNVDPTILFGMTDEGPTRVEEAFFVRGVGHPYGPCSDEFTHGMARVPLSEVEAVAFSETVRDLLSLVPGKA